MAALAAALSVLAHSAFAATATFAFDIPREDLALALNQIAQQSHIEISYSAELTRGKISPVLKGTYTPEQALKVLLKGSGLHVRRIAGGALVIEKEGPAKSPLGGHLSSERYEYAQPALREVRLVVARCYLIRASDEDLIALTVPGRLKVIDSLFSI